MARTDSVCDPAAPVLQADPAASAARWPDHSFLELGALPTAVPCARLHTTLVLHEWGLDPLSDAAELVASELITNAIQASDSAPQAPHGPAPGGLAVVRLHLASDRHQLLVEVGDNDPRPPAPVKIDPEQQGGRGLLLVQAVSARWGCYFLNPGLAAAEPASDTAPPRPGTKVVWALLMTPKTGRD